MRVLFSAAFLAVVATGTAAAAGQSAGPHRWTLGGISGDQSSLNFVDLANVAHV